MIQSYFDQLQALAVRKNVDLREAFAKAGVPSSTFYRTRKGSDLSFSIVQRVERAINSPPSTP